MIEFLTGILGNQALMYAGTAVGGFIFMWLVKKIPIVNIKKWFGGLMYSLGVLITLGLAKWKFTAKFWNKVIEPVFIDLVDEVIGFGIHEFIRGLKSDNEKSDHPA